MRSGLLAAYLLPISQWITRHRDRCYWHLRRVVDTGDPEPWMRFFANGVRDAALGEIEADEFACIEHSRVGFKVLLAVQDEIPGRDALN